MIYNNMEERRLFEIFEWGSFKILTVEMTDT